VSIRYETLVADTHGDLQRIAAELGVAPRRTPAAVLADVNFDALRGEARNEHFWRGQPGGWRRLLTGRVARRIHDAQRNVFAQLGYEVDPDPALDRRTARARWSEVAVPPPAATLG
jgi:hypothetical protein